MSLTAAAGGFVVFLLSLPVVQGQSDWGVTYTSTDICALKGSTVDINCTYSYPSRINDIDTTVEKTFWFIEWEVDLKTDSEYAGRVQYHCNKSDCTLRITDLRESDSAEYKFRLITNQGKIYGPPGVTLSVTDLQVQVRRPDPISSPSWAELKCLSSCPLPDRPVFIWYKNGQKIKEDTSPSYKENIYYSADSFSCAVKRSEDLPPPLEYAPKLPSVSVSPSGEIVEGSSVNLTCSSDANPAANYTWYKENQTLFQGPKGSYNFISISSDDRGIYHCKSENQYGWINSSSLFINVLYAPKLPSVSVSPSAEIVEGSSVNLTCSSDANPAANYTWYKENEDSPKASGQIFIITDFRPEHSGNYYCEAQNRRGRQSVTIHLTVAGSWKLIAAGTITAILLVVLLIPVALWIRASMQPSKRVETLYNSTQCLQTQPEEQQDAPPYTTVQFSKKEADPLYSNIRPAQPQRNKEEEEEMKDVEYATVKTNSGNAAPS